MCTRPTLQSLLGFAFILATPIALWAQVGSPSTDQYGRWINGVSEPWWLPDSMAKQDVEAFQQKWIEINGDNKATTANEWEGNYSEGGETHGRYLRWSVTHGYVLLHVDLCAAQVMSLSYGKVVQTATLILLEPQKTFAASQYRNHHTHNSPRLKFVPVKWRGVPYLVAEGTVGDFCNYLAGLGKFNSDIYWVESPPFLSKGGVSETGTPDDLPLLPATYKRFVRRPIEANVMAIGQRIVRRNSQWTKDYPFYESVTQVRINAGGSSGVQAGMRFYLLDSLDDELVIRRVGPRWSWGEVIRVVDDAPGLRLSDRKDIERSKPAHLARGDRVTTNYHKHLALSIAEDPK